MCVCVGKSILTTKKAINMLSVLKKKIKRGGGEKGGNKVGNRGEILYFLVKKKSQIGFINNSNILKLTPGVLLIQD